MEADDEQCVVCDVLGASLKCTCWINPAHVDAGSVERRDYIHLHTHISSAAGRRVRGAVHYQLDIPSLLFCLVHSYHAIYIQVQTRIYCWWARGDLLGSQKFQKKIYVKSIMKCVIVVVCGQWWHISVGINGTQVLIINPVLNINPFQVECQQVRKFALRFTGRRSSSAHGKLWSKNMQIQ